VTITAKSGRPLRRRGDKKLPKQARPGVAWLTARVPAELHDAIKDLADGERRSMSTMAILLLEEALKARGIVVTKPRDALEESGGSD